MGPISIVIPCLNEEHYIGKLLDCLISQTYKHFEVIVVDGNSKDKTCAIVESYIDKHTIPIHLLHAEKKGVSRQRNLGAEQAIYERLLFLDADSQVKPHFLQHTLQEIEKRHLELATCEYEPLSTRVDDKLLYAIANTYIKVLQYIEPVSMGWCIFSTKRVHQMITGFNEAMKLGEDYDYVVRAAERGVKLKVLHKGKVFISVRRLSEEGRLNYYKKAVLAEVDRYTNGKIDQEKFVYETGRFKEDIEAMKLSSDKQFSLEKILQALKIGGKE